MSKYQRMPVEELMIRKYADKEEEFFAEITGRILKKHIAVQGKTFYALKDHSGTPLNEAGLSPKGYNWGRKAKRTLDSAANNDLYVSVQGRVTRFSDNRTDIEVHYIVFCDQGALSLYHSDLEGRLTVADDQRGRLSLK